MSAMQRKGMTFDKIIYDSIKFHDDFQEFIQFYHIKKNVIIKQILTRGLKRFKILFLRTLWVIWQKMSGNAKIDFI